MSEEYKIKALEDADFNITQDFTYPERFDLNEIIQEIELAVSKMDTRSNNEFAIFLRGQKSGVEQVVKYLKRIAD